jgi:hypothetical protein
VSPSLTIAAPVVQALESVRALAQGETRELLRLATPEERAEWLLTLQQLTDAAAAAEWLVATEVFDARGDGQTLRGAASTQAWIRSTCRTSGTEASRRVRLARASREALGDPVCLLASGAITYEHLQVIDRGTRRLNPEQRKDAVQILATLAEATPVSDVYAAAQHLAQTIDPDGTLADAEQQFDRRHLTMAPLLDGMTSITGLLDTESAAVMDAALQPFVTPDGPGDNRSNAQRRADGLIQVLASACDARRVPQAGGERPHLAVVVNAKGQAHLSPRREALHPLAVARIACDAQLTPLILDPSDVVVDLGRTQRLFSTQQRKLLAARDGGCRWPGCHRPPAHTDAHHVIAWHEGGHSDVTNALLLCRFHHRQVHEGGWRIRVDDCDRGTNGAVTLTSPYGPRLSSVPRGP